MTPPTRLGIAIELVDHHGHAFGLDALHDALDGARAEVVDVRLPGRAVHADDRLFLALADLVPRHLQHLVGDEVFAGSADIDDGRDRVLRRVLVVHQQPLGIFGQAVAAVAKARAVTAGANTQLQAHAVDDGAGVKACQGQLR